MALGWRRDRGAWRYQFVFHLTVKSSPLRCPTCSAGAAAARDEFCVVVVGPNWPQESFFKFFRCRLCVEHEEKELNNGFKNISPNSKKK